MRTSESQSNMRGLRLVGEDESGSASATFGPVRAGLITSPAINKDQALSELLNSLEREVENLNSKYCEAYVTLVNVMEHLVKLTALLSPTSTTEEAK